MSWIPEDGIGVEILGWIEPQLELHLSVSFPLCEHIFVERVWVSAKVPQELEIYFVMCRSLRWQLLTGTQIILQSVKHIYKINQISK